METQTQKDYFLSQPHQPFFLLGVINAVVMMLLFALAYKGVLLLSIETLTFHVFTLSFLLFSNVFTGFLFTTFPRFNQGAVIEKRRYTEIFYASVLGSLIFLLGSVTSVYLVALAMLMTLITQTMIVQTLHKIYASSKVKEKSDSLWILSASYYGLLGNVLFLLSLFVPWLLNLAINVTFYLYLIFLSLSVAQRMIPFFSHSLASKNKNFMKIVFALLILRVGFALFDIKIALLFLDLSLGALFLQEFLRWGLKPLEAPAILWVLHLALFWLPVAFLLSALSLLGEIYLETSFYFLNTHLLAIGFLSTLLIGFGTRVTLGHSAQPPHADKLATMLFFFIQLVVIVRALFSLNVGFGWGLDFLFDISFTLWIILFVVWGLRYGGVLISGRKL